VDFSDLLHMYCQLCRWMSVIGLIMLTSGRHCTQMVQSHSPGGANVHTVHPHLVHGSVNPLDSSSQMAARSVQPFFHSTQQRVPIPYNGLPPFPPSKLPLAWRSGPHLMHGSLDRPESTSQMASPSVQPFLHSSLQNVPILSNGPPLPPPLKIASHHGGIWTRLIHGSLSLLEHTTQMASRLVQPFLQG